MSKRMGLMLAIVIVILAIIAAVKVSQIRSAMAQQGAYQPPPEAVTTTVARQAKWDSSLNAIGSVVAVNGVDVSADLPGVVESINFTSGQRVNKGDLLLQLDTRQERAQLAAATSQLDLSRLDLERARGLYDKGIVPQSTFDQLAAQQKQAEARAGEIRATIDRKIIRAPFTGVLGIRNVNLGQYLAGGAPIVSLQSLQPVYVQFTVPQQVVPQIRARGEVSVTSDGFQGSQSGKVSAIDAVVDEATRNMRVQAIFENRNLELRPGMFVQVQIASGTSTDVLTLPASAISYAPFGDSIFIVEQVKGPDGKSYLGVRQQFVKLGGARGDQVAVLTGLKAGEEVVTSGVFKLRPGAAVQVNNTIQPGNDPAPKPEDS